MLKKEKDRNAWDLPKDQWLALLLSALPFLIGGVLGCMLAASASGESDALLREYINTYLSAMTREALPSPGVVSVMWDYFRFPLVAVVLSFTALGLIGIPILFGVRGFLLSFSVTSFVRLFGTAGAGMAFLLFGLSEVIVLPVFFLLGIQGIGASARLLERISSGKRGTLLFDRAYLWRCFICAAVLFTAALLHFLLLPSLPIFLTGGE